MNIDIIILSLEIVSWYYIDKDMEIDHNGALCGGIDIGTILMHCYILHCIAIPFHCYHGFRIAIENYCFEKGIVFGETRSFWFVLGKYVGKSG